MTLACTLRALLAVIPALLAGCAGLKSEQVDDNKVSGVAYYMPMRAFVLTVTKEKGVVKSLAWAASDPVPDLRKAYSLAFNPHWIGKTKIDVVVGQSGLLGAANTATTSSITELSTVLNKSVAADARTIEPSNKCPDEGAFVFYLMKVSALGNVCGGEVEYAIKALAMGAPENPEDNNVGSPRHIDAKSSVQGVFYRVNRPYTASAWAIGPNKSMSVLSTNLLSVPNESPTMYLPFGKTLFAANDAKVTFSDGVLSKYVQEDEGELVALLQFPAKILGAYFTAIGNLFTAFSDKETNEAQLKLDEFKLALLADKLAKCKEALDKKDEAALTALSCSTLSVSK
ncbi:hypothetical protein [Pseudorhodoferax sp.]|uniref:hypothetical protein n=1 Tax=Pseudorhodoferax sp. TaxID=1993553 RepID=UPI002DD6B9FB|nr:hypothetical protein [Pseudorhodoferax sp.]